MARKCEPMNKKALRSHIGLLSALSLVVGIVLGAGAFMKPAAVLAAAGDSTWALAAWVIGGLFSMAGGLTLCELGVMFPRTGGVFVYLEELYDPKVSFLYGWMLAVIFGPATIGALTGYFSSVFCLLFNVPDSYAGVIGAAVLLFVSFINSIGIKAAGYLQTFATFCKLIPVILIIVFGLWKGNGQVLFMHSGLDMGLPFSAAVLATLFAYDGWAQVASVAGEMKNPGKILPRAIIGGLSFLIIVYIAINVALLKVMPADKLVALGHDASSIAAQNLFGLAGGNMIAVGIMISIIGGLNGYIMTLSRVIYTMGLRRQLPGAHLWGKIDEDSNAPVNAMLLLAGSAYLYYRLLDADKLSNVAVFSIWVFYLLIFIGVLIARRTHADIPRGYKVPFYPVIPLIAIGGAIYVIYGMITSQFANALISVVLTLAGLPVYYYLRGSIQIAGVWSSIKTKYMIATGSIVILGLLTISAQIFDTRPLIHVGTEAANPPFSFEGPNGRLTGFDIEIMNAVAQHAGMKVSYRPISLEYIFDAVEQGDIEVAVCALSVTPKRKEKVAFTNAYIDGGLALLVKNTSTVKSSRELVGKSVGVRKGSTSEYFAGQIAGATVQVFNSNFDMSRAFNRGEFEALIFDKPVLEYLMSQETISNATIIQTINKEEYAIVFSKHNKKLGDKLNKALAEIKKNGELAELHKKWFGTE